ncbi:MAG: type I DNA topoisomerase [Planctomycetota bacterium]
MIVESPAKAKTINRYLGDAYTVAASMGHVRDLPRKRLSVDLEHDFEPTYEIVPERRKVLAALKKQARKAPAIYLATDLDREGEAIAWHLAESLDVPGERIRRVTFNEITAPAITDAFQHPRGLEMNRVNAQQARRILDRLVGYQISPLLWRKVATGLSAGRVQSVAVRLAVDREREIEAFVPEEFWRLEAVFTTDLAAAAHLHRQWRQFLTTPDAKGAGPTKDAQQHWLGERHAFWAELTHLDGRKIDLSDETAARRITEALGVVIEDVERTEHPDAKGPARRRAVLKTRLYNDDGSTALTDFAVTGLDERRSVSRPPKPFTTASLQQAASARLRFSASRTMRVAQQLYEGVAIGGEGSVGLITYMRTDSLNLSNEALSTARRFIDDQFGGDYVPEKPNRYVAGGRAQEAHEAIRPTDVQRTPDSLRRSLTEPQWKLYRLIWERFVACQMTPAVWSVTDATITAATSAGEARFRAVGRRLVFDGFMKVTGASQRGGDQILPHLTPDQPLGPMQLDPQQRFTQPPPRYTEASLVRALEAEGIGRPSTYASIIQTIQDRAYVEQIDRRFYATAVGIKVTDKLVEHFPKIMDLRFTAHMEDQLDRIEADDLDWVQVLREFYGPFSENLDRAMDQMPHAKAESEPSEYTCEACGRPMVYRWSRNGRYLACTGYPECKTTHPVDREGKKVEQTVVPGACPECGSDMILRRSRFGPFLGCTRYPECRGTRPCDAEGNPLKVMKDEDVTGECPVCGGTMVVKRKGRRAFLGCTRYPECDGTAPIPEGIHLQAPPKPPPKDTGLQCPKCKKNNLVIRQGPRGEFVACSGFPRCRNSFNTDLLDKVKAAIEADEDAQAIIDESKSKGGGKSGKKAKKGKAKKAKKTKKAKKASKRKTAK